VSDMFDVSDEGLHLLRHLRARRHHVVLFHLFHPDELEFPFQRLSQFESMEDARRVLVDPAGIRRAYHREMGRFRRETRRLCQEAEVEYRELTTDEPLDRVLLGFLGARRGAVR